MDQMFKIEEIISESLHNDYCRHCKVKFAEECHYHNNCEICSIKIADLIYVCSNCVWNRVEYEKYHLNTDITVITICAPCCWNIDGIMTVYYKFGTEDVNEEKVKRQISKHLNNYYDKNNRRAILNRIIESHKRRIEESQNKIEQCNDELNTLQ